jgi:hypothetical protein
VAPVDEVSRFDFVLEEKPPADALVDARAATVHDGMLTTPEDLSGQVRNVLVLPLEAVGRLECARSPRGYEELPSRLSVGPARRAFCGLDERVEATVQIPGHEEGEVGAHARRVTVLIVGEIADPRYLRGFPRERRCRRNDTDKRHYRRVASVGIVNRRFMIPFSCSVINSSCFWPNLLQQKRSHAGAKTVLIWVCILVSIPGRPELLGASAAFPRASPWPYFCAARSQGLPKAALLSSG